MEMIAKDIDRISRHDRSRNCKTWRFTGIPERKQHPQQGDMAFRTAATASFGQRAIKR